VAIDVYEEWVHVQEYQAPSSVDPARAQARLRDVVDAVAEVLETPSDRVFLKVRRRQRGSSQYERLTGRDVLHEVGEGGLRFLVDFAGRLDTGLFLDHRPTRALIRDLAAGGRFLNLFAYTGSASVYAAAGGATETVSVDLSARYLEWAARNLRLNGFVPAEVAVPSRRRGGPGGPAHSLVRADCWEWLRGRQGAQAAEDRYHVVFLDPPTFSNSKRMGDETLDVQRDHVELITLAAGLLEPSGTLVFSTNNRRFRLDAEALAGLRFEDITAKTIPPDFERNPRIHSCWLIRL
jgi:23S rRNA (guanine2445-N2)-methyltransferase / 23S rRNA (guanine2069-N7)-methyltransferase